MTLCLGKQTVPSRCDVDLIFGAGVHDSAAVLPVKGMLPVQDLANFDLPERMLTRIVLIGILTLGDREVSMRPERPAPFIPYCEMGTQHLGWAAVSGKLSAPPELRS